MSATSDSPIVNIKPVKRTRADRLTWKVMRAKELAKRAPSKAQGDERELQLIQIQMLAEILQALWRAEK